MDTILTTTTPRAVDAPASNELERAQELGARLAFRLHLARKHDNYVQLSIADAEELCQLLHDSIRTAKQLKGQA